MISKSQIKYIQSLHRKKYRDRYKLYIVEGEKIVGEYLDTPNVFHSIYATSHWFDKNHSRIENNDVECHEVTEKELKKISALSSPNQVLALIRIPDPEVFDLQSQQSGVYLAVDSIKDPGNLGTLIRTADWFGIDNIFCSSDCVEAYNPKVVQATMGSLVRTKVHYTELSKSLCNISLPVIAATLKGKNIFNVKLPKDAVILIGSESKGISPSLLKLAHEEISIPKIGKAESLNAAIATGIILASLRFEGRG